jgi:hypothetical protein
MCTQHPDYKGDKLPENQCSTCWDDYDIMHRVIEAPQWLKDRMEAVRNAPPPTIEQVRAQFARCAELSKEFDFKDLKVLCQKVIDGKMTLDEFLDECQMLYLSNGWNVEKRI